MCKFRNMSLKLYYSIFALTIIQGCSYSQKCSDFHNGTFEIADKEHDYFGLIVRNDSVQIETNQKTGKITKCSINWINDCTYELTYLETDSPIIEPLIGKKLTTEINSIDGKVIYFTSTLDGIEFEAEHLMTKIK